MPGPNHNAFEKMDNSKRCNCPLATESEPSSGHRSNDQRVAIGGRIRQTPIPRQIVGVPMIYLPLLFLPFVRLSAALTYWHLRVLGADNIKTLREFLPDKASHRYDLKSQILAKKTLKVDFWSGSRSFWIFNCTFYCPYAVGLFAWHAYLVKVVENFWCPFHHSHKETYADAAIDKSFWHAYPEDVVKLHPDDRDNPIWNAEAAAAAKASESPRSGR